MSLTLVKNDERTLGGNLLPVLALEVTQGRLRVTLPPGTDLPAPGEAVADLRAAAAGEAFLLPALRVVQLRDDAGAMQVILESDGDETTNERLWEMAYRLRMHAAEEHVVYDDHDLPKIPARGL